MNLVNASADGDGEVEPQPPIPFGSNEAVVAAPVLQPPSTVPNALFKPPLASTHNHIRNSIPTLPDSPMIGRRGIPFESSEEHENPNDVVVALEGWIEILSPKRMGLGKVDTREGSSSPSIKRLSHETKWKQRYFKLMGSQLVYYKANPNTVNVEEIDPELSTGSLPKMDSSSDLLATGDHKHFHRLRSFIHKRRHSEDLKDHLDNGFTSSSPPLREGVKEVKKQKRSRLGYIQLQGCRVDPSINVLSTQGPTPPPFHSTSMRTTMGYSHIESTTTSTTYHQPILEMNAAHPIYLEDDCIIDVVHPHKQHIFFINGVHQKEKIMRSRSSIARLRFSDKETMERWLQAMRISSRIQLVENSKIPGSPAFLRNSSSSSGMEEIINGEDFSKYNSYSYISDATVELLDDPSVMQGGVLRIRSQKASRIAFFILEDCGKLRWYSIPVKNVKNQIGVFKLKSWDMTLNRKAHSFKLSNNSNHQNIKKAKNEAKTLFGNDDTFLFRAKDDEDFDKWVQCIGTFTRTIPGQAPELEDDISVNVWDIPSGKSESCSWFNLIMARNFQDMQNSTAFFNHVQEKLQRKLDTAGKPEWVGPIKIVDLNIGTQSPIFKEVTIIESEIPNELKGETFVEYHGGFSFTITSSITISIGKTFNLPISVKVTLPRLIGKLYLYISPILHEPCTAFFAEPPHIEFETHVEVNETVFANKVPRFTEFLTTTLKRAFYDRTVYPNKMIFNLPFPGRKMRFSAIKTGKLSKYPRKELMDVGLFTEEYALLCKDVLNRTADMWTFGAFTSVHDLFCEGAQLHGLAGSESEQVGKEAIKAKLRDFRRSFVGNAKMVATDIVVNNDFACCKLTIQGLMGKPFADFRPSEHTNEVFMEATSVFKIRGTHIQEWWLSWTPATIIQYTLPGDEYED